MSRLVQGICLDISTWEIKSISEDCLWFQCQIVWFLSDSKINHEFHCHFKGIPNKYILTATGQSYLNLEEITLFHFKGWILKIADLIYVLLENDFFFWPCLPALGDTLLSLYLPCELKMGGSAQSYCFFTLEKGVVSVYTWSFLLEYFQSYPDPEGGLFIREESLLRLWCLKTCSAFFLHSDSIHWHWSVQRTHVSHRLTDGE